MEDSTDFDQVASRRAAEVAEYDCQQAAHREERFRALGFYPQREINCNQLLPYASQIDEESQRMLAEIKANMAKAIMCLEFEPGTWFWVSRLGTYVKLYGLKFSRDDHVQFIKVLMSLLEIPYLEPYRVNCILSVVHPLLQKSKLLSPADLQIEWRPLYKLVKIYLDKKTNKGQFYRFCNSIETFLMSVVEKASLYFPPGTTKEVMDELLPLVYPLDTGKHCDTISNLSLFLNYLDRDCYELWLPHMLNLWDTYENPTWASDILINLSTLARNNVGRIDWDPHFPVLYTRILRSIGLPVLYKTMRAACDQKLDLESAAEFIAFSLGPLNSGQTHLSQLLGSLETFIHPANTGKWTARIGELLALIAHSICKRVKRERYCQHPWKWATPEEHKLSETCITRFVESMRSIAFQVLYSRIVSYHVRHLFSMLANLRPELVCPGVVERVYTTLDSLTEPHKLTATLQCLVSVSRPLVSGHNGYTAGKTHVIPIFFAVLPGIDPNDFRKTAITLDFLTSFALLVPIIDCSQASKYHSDLSEEERLICDQSAEFELFVLQYLDQVFAVIKASAQQTIRLEQDSKENRSRLEQVADASLLSSTHGILGQCSPEIVASATQKFVQFVRTNLFETNVAAPMVGSLVRVFSRVASAEIRRTLFPWLLQSVRTFVDEHEDCERSTKQNDELQYYLTLIDSYMRGHAESLLAITDDVLTVYDLCRKFQCPATTNTVNSMMANYMYTVSGLQSRDLRSSPESFELPLSEHLPIRHWGEKSTRPIDWYVPDERARATCERIIHRYLPEYLEELEQFAAGTLELKREELERTTMSVLSLLKCSNFLPNWVEEPLFMDGESIVERTNIDVKLSYEQLSIAMPGTGENIRVALVQTLVRLQDKMLRDCEDDSRGFQVIVALWDLVHARRRSRTTYKAQMKAYQQSRTFQENLLSARPLDIRAVVATRVLIQHDVREQMDCPEFTATNALIMRQLLRCATAKYAVVRQMGQLRLFQMMQRFPWASRVFLDDICAMLAMDVNAEHDRIKGALFVLNGATNGRLILQHNWDTLERLWLALLRTKLSEKPSVVQLMDSLVESINEEFPTISIEVVIPEKCVRLAEQLVSADVLAGISEADRTAGQQRMLATNARNRATYERLLERILEITHQQSLHWRYGRMASQMINALLHPQIPYPLAVARYAVHNLIHESIQERKMAIKMLGNVLYQLKREHIRVPLDVAALLQPRDTDSPTANALTPGMRADNRFLQYDLATVPRSQAEWDEPKFVFKTLGFFGWPTGYQVYAPSAEQPQITRDRELMSAVEVVIYDFFTDAASVARLCHFWSMEEKRGGEKFHRSRLLIVKCLADLFGMAVVEPLLVHVERLIGVRKNLESSHRCAAELMGGIMRGVKHWPYAETAELYEKRLVPMVRTALTRITVETDRFWGTCFATAAENIDPRRQWWLHEVLLEDPMREERSFADCIRIYCLQGPFNQHVWRMNSVSIRLLDYLRPYLNHPFQNVRERIGSLLINVFESDLEFRDGNAPECPRIGNFITEIMARLQCLNGEMPEAVKARIIRSNTPDSESEEEWATDSETEADTTETQSQFVDDDPQSPEIVEYESALRLFKTMVHWMTGIINRSTNGNRAEFFQLLPLTCRLEHCEQDDELAEICSALLALIAQALTLAPVMPVALATIQSISRMSSWSARVAILDVMQVMVFNNMAIVLSRPEWVQQVQTIVLDLMEDTVLEVRAKAAQVLCGLLHCSFLPATDKLLELFKRKCRTKLAPKASRSQTAASMQTTVVKSATTALADTDAAPMRKRHMGVMGLCAFITAYPYEIPDFVPDVFEHLGAHLNDPQPIPSTIRMAVGNFKRTHHDNWAEHKLKFTEDQLAVLSDLTIPPSYYA